MVAVVREVAESEAVAKGMVVAVRDAASMVVEATAEAVTVTVVEVKAAAAMVVVVQAEAAVAAATGGVASVAVASVVVASAAAETVAVVREVAESEAVAKGMVVAVREAASMVVEATVEAGLRSAAARRELHLGHSATHQHLQQMEADLAEALRHLAHRAAGLALACEAGCFRHWRAGARKAWQPEASAERRSCPGRLHCRL